MNPNIILSDGEERNRLNPKRFLIPSLEERQSILVGNFAQIIVGKMHLFPGDTEPELVNERIWVLVTGCVDGVYSGTLNNEPVVIEATFGDPVTFEPRHVIGITTPIR